MLKATINGCEIDIELVLHERTEAIIAPSPAAIIGIIFRENGRIKIDSGWIISQFKAAPPAMAPIVRLSIGMGVTIVSSDIEFKGEYDVGLHSIVVIARAVYTEVKAVAAKKINIIAALKAENSVYSRIKSFE